MVPTKVPFTNTDVPTRGSPDFASEIVPETAAKAEAMNNDAINIDLRILIPVSLLVIVEFISYLNTKGFILLSNKHFRP